MRAAAIPADEPERLSTLHALGLLDTPSERRYDAITATTASLFQAPISLISLVDSKRQWFKSRHGLNAAETPREVSFCGHAILNNELFVVADAASDERFHDNPLVTAEPHVRFYAGRPLAANNGQRIGTLCVIDHKPRTLTSAQLALLDQLGAWAEAEIRMLEEQKALLRYLDHLFELVADPVILGDAQGAVRFANSAALRLLRYQKSEIFGLPLWALLDVAERGAFETELAALERAREEFSSISHAATIVCKDRTRFSVMLTFSKRKVAGRDVVAMLIRQL